MITIYISQSMAPYFWQHDLLPYIHAEQHLSFPGPAHGTAASDYLFMIELWSCLLRVGHIPPIASSTTYTTILFMQARLINICVSEVMLNSKAAGRHIPVSLTLLVKYTNAQCRAQRSSLQCMQAVIESWRNLPQYIRPCHAARSLTQIVLGQLL